MSNPTMDKPMMTRWINSGFIMIHSREVHTLTALLNPPAKFLQTFLSHLKTPMWDSLQFFRLCTIDSSRDLARNILHTSLFQILLQTMLSVLCNVDTTTRHTFLRLYP